MIRNYQKLQREHVFRPLGRGYIKGRRNVLVKLWSVVQRLSTFRHDTSRFCEIIVVGHDYKHVTSV